MFTFFLIQTKDELIISNFLVMVPTRKFGLNTMAHNSEDNIVGCFYNSWYFFYVFWVILLFFCLEWLDEEGL